MFDSKCIYEGVNFSLASNFEVCKFKGYYKLWLNKRATIWIYDVINLPWYKRIYTVACYRYNLMIFPDITAYYATKLCLCAVFIAGIFSQTDYNDNNRK